MATSSSTTRRCEEHLTSPPRASPRTDAPTALSNHAAARSRTGSLESERSFEVDACAPLSRGRVAQDMVLVEQLRDDGSLARITFSSGGEEVDVLELETLCEKVMPVAPQTQPLIPPPPPPPCARACGTPRARCMGRATDERRRGEPDLFTFRRMAHTAHPRLHPTRSVCVWKFPADPNPPPPHGFI